MVHPRADRHAAALEEGHLQNEIQLHSKSCQSCHMEHDNNQKKKQDDW
jgi:hypothetical protein